MHSRKVVVVVLVTLAWAVILLVVRHTVGTAAPEHVQAPFTTPQLRMLMRHVGCSDQDKEVLRALATLPWLGEAQVERAEPSVPVSGTRPDVAPGPHTLRPAAPQEPLELCALRVLVKVTSVEQVDFMRVVATLRDVGVVPVTLEFGGPPRFALQARMADLTCAPCAQTAMDALKPFPVSAAYYYSTTKNPVEVSKQVALQWVEGKSIDHAKNTITVSAQPRQIVRVDEMIRALERAGLLPLSIRVVGESA